MFNSRVFANNMSIDARADEFFESLPCRVQKPYPSTQINSQNLAIAGMLMDAFGSANSETTGLTQYLSHSHTIDNEEIADQLLCVALVEMKHLDMLGNMIVALGGDLRFWKSNKSYWDGGLIGYGDTLCDKLSLDVLSEQEAISGYAHLIRQIGAINDPASSQVVAVLKRIQEDEEVHLAMFKDLYNKACRMR